MVSRNILILCALGLLAVSVSARSVETVENLNVDNLEDVLDSDEDVERGLGDFIQDVSQNMLRAAFNAAIKVVTNEFGQIKPGCVTTIFKLCKSKPKKIVSCATNYYKAHKAECRKDRQ